MGYPCQAQQTTASAHRLRLEEQFHHETKGLMTGEKIVQWESLLLRTVLLDVVTEPDRFVISYLFPFFF